MPTATPIRTGAERLEARVTAEQKRLIEQAAALQGRSVTDFVLSSVQDAARRAIEEHQRLELSARDSQAFVEALLNPPPPNDRLRETVARYRSVMGLDDFTDAEIADLEAANATPEAAEFDHEINSS